MNPNIALVGRRGTGKDTIAAVLTADHGYVRMSWADPVRQIAAMAYDHRFVGSPEDYAAAKAASFEVLTRQCGNPFCDCPATPETISGTQVLQRIGTDAIRDHLDQDFWIKAGIRRLDLDEVARRSETDSAAIRERHWVNTDTRFPNEAEALRSRGWVLVGLSCPEDVRRNRLIARDGFYDEAAQSHPSEHSLGLADCDVVIDVAAPIDSVVDRLMAAFTVLTD